jgi:hypothetical protein
MLCLESFESKIDRHVQRLCMSGVASWSLPQLRPLLNCGCAWCIRMFACSLTCSGSSRSSPFTKFSGTRPTAWEIKAVARQYPYTVLWYDVKVLSFSKSAYPKTGLASVLDHCSRRQGSSSSLGTSLLALQVKPFRWTCAGNAEMMEGGVDGATLVRSAMDSLQRWPVLSRLC